MLLFVSAACGATTSGLKPVLDVITPPDGTSFKPGESVVIIVGATSSNTITRIEIRNNGVLVASQDNPTRTVTFTSRLQYAPTQAGIVHLAVTAIDGSGQQSEPVNLAIVVDNSATADSPGASTDPGPAATPAACKPGAVFVTDVTIPDNTTVVAGTKLVKTWRIRNTGQCAWDNNYQLAFIDGEIMGAPVTVTVAPTARDASVDISVPFIAPQTSGTYTSTWRMNSPDGVQFGNRVYMLIKVQ